MSAHRLDRSISGRWGDVWRGDSPEGAQKWRAFALLVVGISVVGVVTASVAAWLIANVERPVNR